MEVKGGEIHYRDGVFRQINILTREEYILDQRKKNDPLSQAIDGAYHYRTLFDSIEYDFANRFPIETAVWFSGCVVGEKIDSFPIAYREISKAILDATAFQIGQQTIYDIYSFYNTQGKTSITDEEFDKALKLIAQDFDLVVAPGIRINSLDNTFIKLTDEQIGLLDYISEQNSATIQGAAGTGKTIIAKEAARRFAMDGHKVLFLCFNKYLRAELSHRYMIDNVDYQNIHSLIRKYTNEDIFSTTDARVRGLLNVDWRKIDYDDIVIDEAQDFEDEEIVYLKELMERKKGRFLVFYDKNQIVQNKSISKWINESECRLILTKNCRNTYEIAITAYNVIDVELNQKLTMVRGGDTTVLFVNEDPLDRLETLINYYVAQCEYGCGDICLLTLKKEENSILRDVNWLGRFCVSRERNDSSIFFTTARRFKGLESRVVIVIDIDETAFSNDETKRVFYVACSRATQRLTIIIDGDDKKLKKISASIGGHGPMPPKGRILQKVKAKMFRL